MKWFSASFFVVAAVVVAFGNGSYKIDYVLLILSTNRILAFVLLYSIDKKKTVF